MGVIVRGRINWVSIEDILYREVIFVRTTPEQKLCIVRSLQVSSSAVGVTSDGVNDVPAFILYCSNLQSKERYIVV